MSDTQLPSNADSALAQSIWDAGQDRIRGQAADASLMAEQAHVAEIAIFIAKTRLAHDCRVTELLAANKREVENRRQITAALHECEDKLWVLRCNSRDPFDRAAAEAAIAQAKIARETIKR